MEPSRRERTGPSSAARAAVTRSCSRRGTAASPVRCNRPKPLLPMAVSATSEVMYSDLPAAAWPPSTRRTAARSLNRCSSPWHVVQRGVAVIGRVTLTRAQGAGDHLAHYRHRDQMEHGDEDLGSGPGRRQWVMLFTGYGALIAGCTFQYGCPT